MTTFKLMYDRWSSDFDHGSHSNYRVCSACAHETKNAPIFKNIMPFCFMPTNSTLVANHASHNNAFSITEYAAILLASY